MSETLAEVHLESAEPATLRAWLGTLGWDPALGIGSAPTAPEVVSFGPYAEHVIAGRTVAFVLLVLRHVLPLPAGVEESQAGQFAVGVMLQGPRKPTPIEWMDRLPEARQVALHEAVRSLPGEVGALLRYGLYRLSSAREVDAADPVLQQVVGAMLQAGVLTEAEASLLLAA